VTGSVTRYYEVHYTGGYVTVQAHTWLDAIKRSGVTQSEVLHVLYVKPEERDA
jgi:hypothetical protein